MMAIEVLKRLLQIKSGSSNKDTNITLKAIEIVQGTVRLEDGSSASEIFVKLLDENGTELERIYSNEKGNTNFF